MSYILDALKRADAERERGHVPGLHTHNLPPDASGNRRAIGQQARARSVWLVALVVALAMLGALVFWWLKPAGAPLAPSSPAAAPAVESPMPAAPAAAATAIEAAPPAPTESLPPRSSPPEGPTLPILAPQLPRPEPRSPPAPSKKPVAKDATSPDIPTAPGDSAAAPSSPTPTATIPHFGELSAEVRARLPVVNVNGATYSKNPALRMLIVNGKVHQEGQEVAPGLKLETIEPRSAVMNHQGLRYRIGY